MNTDIAQLARLITSHLPAWTADVREFNRAHLHHHQEKWQISLEINYRDSGRIVARGIYHQEAWYHLTHTEKAPKITVAILRGPATIAQEIERRLLPAYIKLYEEIEAADHRRQADLNAEIDAMTLIAEVTHSAIPKHLLQNHRSNNGGLSVRFGQYDNYIWPSGGATNYYNGRMDLRLYKLTPQEAAAVLEKLIEVRQ